MKKNRLRLVCIDCIKRYRHTLLLCALMLVGNLTVFLLYSLDPEPFLYTSALLLFFLLTLFACSFFSALSAATQRQKILSSPTTQWDTLPPPHTLTESDYQQMVQALGQHARQLTLDYEQNRSEMMDYYTAWVHQIKTPIAVLRMLLADEDTENHRAMAAELFRVEQYVDMVLQYIRLDSKSNDLVIREFALDELLQQSIRKFAPQFIGRNIRLNFEPTDYRIVTDEKWFTCIVEQLLSNAAKYTPAGSVTIHMSEGHCLQIEDTGIGIAPEDLPRVFEKGFTGLNGRIGQKSSGLGLYLCKSAADKLSIPLTMESQVGKGTVVTLHIEQKIS